MKLSTRLTFLVISTSIAVVVILGISSFLFTRNTMKEILNENQLQLATFAMREIDKNLYEKLTDVQGFAEDEEIENYLAGKELSNQTALKRLKEWSILSGSWDELALFNIKGEKVLSTNAGELFESFSEKEVVIKALAEDFYYSDFIFSEEEKRPYLIFAASVRDENIQGQPLVGVVEGKFSWPAIVETLERIDNHQAFLLNNQNKIIASNKIDYRIKLAELTDISDLLPEGDFSIGRSVDGTMQVLKTKVDQMGFLNYKGHNWHLLLEISSQEIFSPANNISFLLSAIFILIVIIFVTVLLGFLYKFFIKPVKKLTNTAVEISKGQLNKKAIIDSQDELGKLAQVFNTMLDKLNEAKENVDQKVKERTIDLQKLNKIMTGRELKMVELKKQIKELENLNKKTKQATKKKK